MKSCERVTSLDWKPFTASKALKLTTSQVMESWAIERKCSEHGDEQSEEHPSSFHLQEALRSCSSLHVCKSSKSFLLCKGESWNFQSFARPSAVHLYFQLATWNCDTDIYMRSKQLSLLGSLRLCRIWSFLFPNFSAGHLPWDCNAMQAFRLSTTKWVNPRAWTAQSGPKPIAVILEIVQLAILPAPVPWKAVRDCGVTSNI